MEENVNHILMAIWYYGYKKKAIKIYTKEMMKKTQKDEDEDENYRSIIIDLFELQLELRSRKASE